MMNWAAPVVAAASMFVALALMKEPDQKCNSVTEIIRYLPAPEVKLIMPTDWSWPVQARFDAPSHEEPQCDAPTVIEDAPRRVIRHHYSRHRRRR